MPLKKGTKAYKEEYVYAHYGIHMDTMEVMSVWEKRDGTLSSGSFNHHVLPGRRTEAELLIKFNISDVRTLPISMVQSHGETVRKELQELAAQRRAEHDANPSSPKPATDQ